MKFEEFINLFDYPGSIILLEGKRKVKSDDEIKLFQLAKIIAKNTKYMKFRSGNAGGSDDFFARGIAEIDKSRMQVIIPYNDFRKKSNLGFETFSLDDIDLNQENEVIKITQHHKSTIALQNKYLNGERNRIVKKASFLFRDTIKAIGTSKIPKASAGIFYDDLENPLQGGTGFTIQICQQFSIPFFNQRVWFEWVN